MKDIKNSMLISFFVFFLLVFAVYRISFSEAFPEDAGIITSAKGKTLYSSALKPDEFATVSVLMKVRTGDTVKIDRESELAVLYQANGRREVWKGPAVVKITELKGISEGGDKNASEPGISSIPIEITDSIVIASLSESQASKTRAGIRVVRGDSATSTDTDATLKGLPMYKKLKENLGTDDITPDLYLYSYYRLQGLEKETRSQVQAIIKKWGKSPEMIKSGYR